MQSRYSKVQIQHRAYSRCEEERQTEKDEGGIPLLEGLETQHAHSKRACSLTAAITAERRGRERWKGRTPAGVAGVAAPVLMTELL